MVEYTVETLVHLYDSLNDQIEKVQADIRESSAYCVCQDDTRAIKEMEKAYNLLIKRCDKLIEMRDNVEELLRQILKAELKGVE